MYRRHWLVLGIVLATLAALGAAWRLSPLAAWTEMHTVIEWAQSAGARPWVPVAVLAAYTPASVTLFPRPLITLFAVMAFGPLPGFVFALTGILIAALATYGIGRTIRRARVRRIAGARLARLAAVLRRRGVLAVTAVRLVPIAPFAVVNVVAGALRVRLSHFVLGSALGVLPGTAAATILSGEIADALGTGAVDIQLAAAALLVLVAAAWAGRRWLTARWPNR